MQKQRRPQGLPRNRTGSSPRAVARELQESIMHAMTTSFRRATLCILLLTAARPAAAQVDTTNVPSPPTGELAALEPFFGAYEHSDQYWVGMGPFHGTLDVRPAIKGWYVEWVINTEFGPIDRQLLMLTTWDEELDRYRVWRFETLPQMAPGTVEAEARFDDVEFVMEWKNDRDPWGNPGTFRNRIRMDGPEELVIVSDWIPDDGGEVVRLGVWRNRRVSPAPGS
jgi:hypothetical protein